MICGVLIVLVWMGGSLLLQNIPLWVEGLDDVQQNMRLFVTDCCNGVGGFLGINTEGLAQVLIEQIDVFVENFQVQVLPGILGGTWSYIRQLLSIIGVLAVTMIATMLLAKDYDSILAFMGAHEGSRTVLEIVLRVLRYIATFVKAQVIIMISIAAVCSLSLFCRSGKWRVVWHFGGCAGRTAVYRYGNRTRTPCHMAAFLGLLLEGGSLCYRLYCLRASQGVFGAEADWTEGGRLSCSHFDSSLCGAEALWAVGNCKRTHRACSDYADLCCL